MIDNRGACSAFVYGRSGITDSIDSTDSTGSTDTRAVTACHCCAKPTIDVVYRSTPFWAHSF